MLIFPAIDLLDGRCVRLERGDYGRATVYADDPVEQADAFAAAGAGALHVVDLGGARAGRPVHGVEIGRVRHRFEGFLQVGGGIRSAADVEGYLSAGVDRVILGTAAVDRPEWVSGLVERFGPDAVAAGVDLRGDAVMVEGWRSSAATSLPTLVQRLRDAGIEVLVYTDTLRDGMLGSANVTRARDFVAAGFRTIVAGGVTALSDVERLRTAGAHGAIIGSALYEGRIQLAEVLSAAGSPRPC